VTLTADEAHYTYRSEHLFTRGTQKDRLVREQKFSRERPAGRVPESLWLWGRPAPGCVPLVEELSGRTGEGCVRESHEDHVAGTVLGAPFDARYRDGKLAELTTGSARFTVVEGSPGLPAPPDLFGAGFAVEGTAGRLALAPPAPVVEMRLAPWQRDPARALAERVHDSFSDASPTHADWQLSDADEVGGCLAHARRFQAWARRSGHEAALVFGLLVDGARAYPHAWVRIALASGKTADLDPTTLEEVSPLTHLALGAASSEPGPELGTRYLELARGALRVVRRP
jgi:hypothetical protein